MPLLQKKSLADWTSLTFTVLEMEPLFYCSKQHKKKDLLAYFKYIVEVLSLYKLYFFELRAYRRHKVHFHLVIFKVVPTFYYKSQNDLRRVGGGLAGDVWFRNKRPSG